MSQGLVIFRGTYVNDVEAVFIRLYLLTFPMTFVFCNRDAAIIKDNANLRAFGRNWCESTFIHKQAGDDACRFERPDIDAVATQDLGQMPPDESCPPVTMALPMTEKRVTIMLKHLLCKREIVWSPDIQPNAIVSKTDDVAIAGFDLQQKVRHV
jgi:hypothetical protein